MIKTILMFRKVVMIKMIEMIGEMLKMVKAIAYQPNLSPGIQFSWHVFDSTVSPMHRRPP